jgi:hypothetical protein
MNQKILNQIITKKNLAWNHTLADKPSEFVVKLSNKSINELRLNKGNLKQKTIKKFPFLSQDIQSFKSEKIIHGSGLFLIHGGSFFEFTKSEIKNIYILISMILGELLEQDAKGSKVITVKNRGKSLSTGGRYHQTSDGGSFHTDGPHWMQPPDVIGLLCINPASEGGVSKFISVYTIHNAILKIGMDKLEPLYKNFFFDRREEVADDLRTISKPIFNFEDNKLNCRFLKDYIISGYKIEDVHLTNSQNISIDLIEEITKDSQIALSYNLRINDMVFSHNHRLFHGRTSFKDLSDSSKKRELLRVWIKTNLN